MNSEFRRRVIQVAAEHGVDLIFTFVWQLDDPADAREIGPLVVVELFADLPTRLSRNRGADRIAAKPTKRDVQWSDTNVRDSERHQLNTDPSGARPTPADAFLSRHPHLRLDTTELTAAQTAEAVLAWLDRLR